MKYKILSPKYIYYLGIAVNIAAIFSLVFIYKESLTSNEVGIKIALGTLSMILFIYFLFYINKFIYATIDQDNGMLLYGNLFFNQEVPLGEVKYVGKYLYFRRVIKVQIGQKKYYINSLEDGIGELFNRKQ